MKHEQIRTVLSWCTLYSHRGSSDDGSLAIHQVLLLLPSKKIAEQEDLSSDAELVAVIAAAIAAYEGSAGTDGFRVRSIRKVNNNWKKH